MIEALEERAPDLATVVVGYRWWVVRDELLWSPNVESVRPHAWQPGVNRAECAYGGDHEAPGADHDLCECGLYAWSKLSLCRSADYTREASGVVCLWGDMHIAVGAVRAEYARIMALAPVHVADGRWRYAEIADHYGVPLVARGDLELYAMTCEGVTIPELHARFGHT